MLPIPVANMIIRGKFNNDSKTSSNLDKHPVCCGWYSGGWGRGELERNHVIMLAGVDNQLYVP